MFIIGTTYYNLSLCTDPTTRFQDWREAINGGTGSDMDKIDAAIHAAAYPTQTSQSGKFLTTDGSAVSWADVPKGIFICDYGVTTYADVVSAYEGGKTLIARTSNVGLGLYKYYALVQVVEDNGNYLFVFAYINSTDVLMVYLSYASGWSDGSTTLQAALPSQTSQSGKFLTTDGSSMSWASVPTELPSQTGNNGKYLTTNGSAVSWGSVDALPTQTGNSGKYLTTNGTAASWATVDSSPTSASTNLVSSGGVYTAIDNKTKLIDETTYDGYTTSDWESLLTAGGIAWRYE